MMLEFEPGKNIEHIAHCRLSKSRFQLKIVKLVAHNRTISRFDSTRGKFKVTALNREESSQKRTRQKLAAIIVFILKFVFSVQCPFLG